MAHMQLWVLGGILTAVVVAHPEVVGLPADWGLGDTVRTTRRSGGGEAPDVCHR